MLGRGRAGVIGKNADLAANRNLGLVLHAPFPQPYYSVFLICVQDEQVFKRPAIHIAYETILLIDILRRCSTVTRNTSLHQ
jgi:hypothetical protein